MPRTAKTTWQPGEPLPPVANRRTMTAIISYYHFPISVRKLITWPIEVRKVNGQVIYDVPETVAYAERLVSESPSYLQAGEQNEPRSRQ